MAASAQAKAVRLVGVASASFTAVLLQGCHSSHFQQPPELKKDFIKNLRKLLQNHVCSSIFRQNFYFSSLEIQTIRFRFRLISPPDPSPPASDPDLALDSGIRKPAGFTRENYDESSDKSSTSRKKDVKSDPKKDTSATDAAVAAPSPPAAVEKKSSTAKDTSAKSSPAKDVKSDQKEDTSSKEDAKPDQKDASKYENKSAIAEEIAKLEEDAKEIAEAVETDTTKKVRKVRKHKKAGSKDAKDTPKFIQIEQAVLMPNKPIYQTSLEGVTEYPVYFFMFI